MPIGDCLGVMNSEFYSIALCLLSLYKINECLLSNLFQYTHGTDNEKYVSFLKAVLAYLVQYQKHGC